jgi:hypothetical protein
MNNEDGCTRQGCGNSAMQIIDNLLNVANYIYREKLCLI